MIIELSKNQTKIWRMNQEWYKNGKYNECELFQKLTLKYLGLKNIKKTNDRINLENLQIENIIHPYKLMNGYEYTENFDGKLDNYFSKLLYFNLKFICDKGGSQTRALKNVYEYIKGQFYISKYYHNVIFINILDGDGSLVAKDKFAYISDKFKYLKNRIFIGDMFEFSIWFLKFKVIQNLNQKFHLAKYN